MDANSETHAPRPRDLFAHLRELTDGLGTLIRQHLALARSEIKAEAKEAAQRISLLAAGAVWVLMGALLLHIALAFALAPLMGAGWAFALVAVLALAGGGTLAWAGLQRLKAERVLPRTGQTLRQDKEWVQTLKAD